MKNWNSNIFGGFITAFLFLPVVSIGSDYWSSECAGPMHLPAVGLMEIFQYSPMILGPHEVKEKKLSLDVSYRMLNIYAFHVESDEPFEKGMDPYTFPFKFGTFLLDMETSTVDTTIAYGLTDRVDMMVQLPAYYIGGGFLDGFIEGFHSTFGLNQHRREEMPRDLAQFFYVDKDGRQYWLHGEDLEGWHLGNLVLGGGIRLKNCNPAFSIRGNVKLPTNDLSDRILTGMDGIDASLIYSTAWKWDNTHLYHGGALTFREKTPSNFARFHRLRGSSATTLEFKTKSRLSYLLHLVIQSPYADYPELDSPIFETTFGLRYFTKAYRIDLGIIENLFQVDNSPDIGLHFSIQYRY